MGSVNSIVRIGLQVERRDRLHGRRARRKHSRSLVTGQVYRFRISDVEYQAWFHGASPVGDGPHAHDELRGIRFFTLS